MKTRRTALLLSGTFYGISLFCPVFASQEGHSGFLPGFVCLVFGAFAGQPAWFANPLYFAAVIALMKKKNYITIFFSCFALAAAAATVSIKQIPKNEAGDMTAVVGYGPGFYLWVSSMLVVLVAAGIGILKPETSNNSLEANPG
jgi:hypothetical protein